MVINVGSGTETSIRDLVRLVMDVTGVEGRSDRQPDGTTRASRACAPI